MSKKKLEEMSERLTATRERPDSLCVNWRGSPFPSDSEAEDVASREPEVILANDKQALSVVTSAEDAKHVGTPSGDAKASTAAAVQGKPSQVCVVS